MEGFEELDGQFLLVNYQSHMCFRRNLGSTPDDGTLYQMHLYKHFSEPYHRMVDGINAFAFCERTSWYSLRFKLKWRINGDDECVVVQFHNYAYEITVSGTPKCKVIHNHNNRGDKRARWIKNEVDDVLALWVHNNFLRECTGVCGINYASIEHIDLLENGDKEPISFIGRLDGIGTFLLLKDEVIEDVIMTYRYMCISFVKSRSFIAVQLSAQHLCIKTKEWKGKRMGDIDVFTLFFNDISTTVRCMTNVGLDVIRLRGGIMRLRYLTQVNGVRSFQRLWKKWWYEPNAEGYARYASRMYEEDSKYAA